VSSKTVLNNTLSKFTLEGKRRDGSIFGEVFFVKIVFLEKKNDVTQFELIRKGTIYERKVYEGGGILGKIAREEKIGM